MHAKDDYIPMKEWGKDHWSTLAYLETVMVECAGFQIGTDPRMKSNRRHARIMMQGCARPKRAQAVSGMPIIMNPEHATKLASGVLVEDHDDWCCVQDMCAAGLFTITPEDIDTGVVLHLSPAGSALVAQLRTHKASGGSFATFIPEASEEKRVTSSLKP